MIGLGSDKNDLCRYLNASYFADVPIPEEPVAGLDSVLFSSCGTVREDDDGDEMVMEMMIIMLMRMR